MCVCMWFVGNWLLWLIYMCAAALHVMSQSFSAVHWKANMAALLGALLQSSKVHLWHKMMMIWYNYWRNNITNPADGNICTFSSFSGQLATSLRVPFKWIWLLHYVDSESTIWGGFCLGGAEWLRTLRQNFRKWAMMISQSQEQSNTCCQEMGLVYEAFDTVFLLI